MTLSHQPIKDKIAAQFSRAATRYNQLAKVQNEIAQDAIGLLPKHSDSVLDIGCGTGRYSQNLGSLCEQLVAIDLAMGMLSVAKKQTIGTPAQWIQGDAEHLPLQSSSIDTVFSSMALQWCKQPLIVMQEVSRVLKPGGRAVLAIMCEGSLHELQQSWAELDSAKHVNRFASSSTWQNAGETAELKVESVQRQYVSYHPTIRSLLASIKGIGANVLLDTGSEKGQQTPMTRASLKQLELIYQHKFADNGQLPLSYQVCYLSCSKK